MGGRLAGRAGADDDEVVSVHPRMIGPRRWHAACVAHG